MKKPPLKNIQIAENKLMDKIAKGVLDRIDNCIKIVELCPTIKQAINELKKYKEAVRNIK